MAGPAITRMHRVLIGVVGAGAFIIAGIGFTGSYAAVRTLALHKGFGDFSYVFPIGVDVGIAVLLALDLVLTWLRIPFPLLRQTAWLLTGGTIVFNAASSWGDPLAMGMHAIIPVLFVVVVEAARHAVGRMADITADRHMESVRLMRWLLSPIPTFRLWRRMKLWELRSYDDVVRLEQNRLVYRTHLRARYGRNWRRLAPIETLLPLKLAKYGVPLDMSIIRDLPELEPPEVAQIAAAPAAAYPTPFPAAPPGAVPMAAPAAMPGQPQPQPQQARPGQPGPGRPAAGPQHQQAARPAQPGPTAQQQARPPRPVPKPIPDPVAVDVLTKLAIHRHRRPLHDPDTSVGANGEEQAVISDGGTRGVGWLPKQRHGDGQAEGDEGPEAWFAPRNLPDSEAEGEAQGAVDPIDAYLDGLVSFRETHGVDPDPALLSEHLYSAHGVAAAGEDRPIGADELRRRWPELQERYAARFE